MSEFIEILSSQGKKELDDFITKLEQGVEAVNKINVAFKNTKVPSDTKKVIETTNKEIQKSNKLKTEAEKLDISLQRANERLNASRSKSGRELQKVRVEQTAVNRAAKEEATLNSSLVGAYQKLNLQRSQASKRLRDLLASEKASNSEIRKAQAEFDKLDSRIRKADMAVRDHTKNVGNYRSALGGLGGSLRSLMGAFGMIGGIYLFANALRDAFSRVREFDKAMQNLTGIFGTSRDELKDLEMEIRNVAGSSLNTSNQVANLATAMVALGKTKREVIQLLKPVNDLSIALGSSAEATGEFLIQTLNAFGKGADSGDEFANIIAKVRTSTALDFERIQLAMGYLAPVANALNMSLEETSAILGVLVDNGIKAQRAGRLMATAFSRLATDGISLEQALDKINNSQDKLLTSFELFGAEAGSLGLILAANIDKVDEYTESFENASGSLDKLTNEQLKSMDAQLKILDSTWESLVLSIENGEGTISKSFAKIIGGVTKVLNKFIELNSTAEELWGNAGGKAAKDAKKLFEEFGKEKAVEILRDKVKDLNKELDGVNEKLEKSGKLFYTDENFNITAVGTLERQAHDLFGQILELNAAIGTMGEKYNEADVIAEDFGETIEGNTKSLNDKRKAVESLLEPYQKYIDRLKAVQSEFEKQQGIQLKEAQDRNKSTDALIRYATNAGHTTEKVKQLRMSVEELRDIFGSLNTSTFNIDFANIGTIFHGITDGFESAGEAAEAFGKLAIDVFSEITRSQNLNLQNQINNLELQRNVEIEFAGDSAAARGQIEERFNKEKLRLQREQAKNSKAMAIMEAIVATAVAVTKALSQSPILAALVGALGAAQVATIISTPLPQFKDGVRNFEGGQAIVGDGGKREPITDKSGKLIGISPAKSTLVDLPKGANVYSSEGEFYRELNGLLGSNNIIPIPTSGNGITEDEVYRAMKKAIGDRPSETIVLDKNGFTISMVKGSTKVNKLNNRVTVKGRNV